MSRGLENSTYCTHLQEWSKGRQAQLSPISVLPFITKSMFNQIYEYLDANKSLYEHQSGCGLLHSVTTDLMASTNDVGPLYVLRICRFGLNLSAVSGYFHILWVFHFILFHFILNFLITVAPSTEWLLFRGP